MKFPTPNFSSLDFGLKSLGLRNLGLKSSWLKSLGLKSPGLESSWLKSLGLKGLGLKFGVEKSGVEMSFNRHFYIDINYMDRALMPNIFTPLPKSKNNKIFSPILGWHCWAAKVVNDWDFSHGIPQKFRIQKSANSSEQFSVWTRIKTRKFETHVETYNSEKITEKSKKIWSNPSAGNENWKRTAYTHKTPLG